MNKKDLCRMVTNCIILKNNEQVTGIDEVFIMTNPHKDGAFFLIIKQKGKYTCIGNWLHTCNIESTVAEISVKFDCTRITPFAYHLAVCIKDDCVRIYTCWDN